MAEFTITTTYNVDCPACDDGNVVKVGRQAGQQRYKCKSCGKKFRANGKAEGRKYDAELVGATIRDFFMGLSLKQLAESIEDRYDINEPSKSTLYRWVSEYTDDAQYALRDVKAKASKHWVADEMWMQVGGINVYYWIVMDRGSRYILAAHLSPRHDKETATKVMQQALDSAERPPDKITTDHLSSYRDAIKTVFPPTTKHIESQGITHFINNNLAERVNNTYRAREKTLRGMWSLESGQHLLDGFTITYNHFRKHHGLKGRKPAQVAKVNVPYKEWADFVRADIEVPESERVKVTKRGTARVPRERVERAKEIADKKKAKRYGSAEGRAKGKGKGRIRGPKVVLPDVTDGHVDKQLPFPIARPAAKTTSDNRPSEMNPRRAKAPQPVIPIFQMRPQPRPHHLQPEMFTKQLRPIPKRVRPQPVGHKRR